MKNVMRGLGWLPVFGSSAPYAALTDETTGMSLLVYLFFAVVLLIIGTQVIPACVLLIDTIKSAFGAKEEKEADEN